MFIDIGKSNESEEFCKKINTTVFAWSDLTNEVNFNPIQARGGL